ncbi:Exosome complex exonuclease RRP44 [Cryptosporidium felis]|nr:Exosome complex exonuclease RRP44 [Cryptosporidium felis]
MEDLSFNELNSYTKTIIKKTKRGKIRKISNEVYTRSNILCGISFCTDCYGTTLSSMELKNRNVVFPNFDILIHYSDFILEDESLNHVIIPYSTMNYLSEYGKLFMIKLKNKLKDSQKYEFPLINDCELNVSKKDEDAYLGNQFIRFPDTQFNETISKHLTERMNIEESTGYSLINTVTWYIKHLSKNRNANFRFYLLSEDLEWKKVFLSHLSSYSNCVIASPSEYVNLVLSDYKNAGEKLPLRDSIPSIQESVENSFIFPEHLKDCEIVDGIDKGLLFKGIIRMISRDKGEVEVATNDTKITISIVGNLNLNRCIDGDLVVVRLDETIADDKKILQIQLKSELGIDNIEELENNEIPGIGRILLGDDDYDENSALKLQNVEHVKSSIGVNTITTIEENSYSGRVVGIISRNWGEYCGSLIPIDSLDNRYNLCHNSSTRQHRIFVPIDPKIPKIIIRTKLSSILEQQRLVVVIDDWDRSSFYPTGHLVAVLGNAGDVETETSVILRKRGIISSEFSPSVLQCLPNYGLFSDWSPNDIDLRSRTDLRNRLVFSVDPPGCKDIDDALSIEQIQSNTDNNGDNWYKVSVHIADVTHFVKPNTPIDDEASRRSTTCYLVNRRIDMLPEELTTNICSLVSNKDRLAFSCNWEMNENAEIRKISFDKTVINSKYSFTYTQAQDIIDDANDCSEVAISLRKLLDISKILKKNRIDRGAIELSSSEVKIELEEYGAQYCNQNSSINDFERSKFLNIKDISIYNHLSTNSMVEEFMLLANTTVAKYILRKFPHCCLLRRHPEPNYDQLKKLENVLRKIGIDDFCYKSSQDLAKSLNKIQNSELVQNSPIIGKLIRILTTRTMNQALYFTTCRSSEGKFHYGLAEEIYTHFTSPIRRYADIIVHRLLSASIDLEPLDESIFDKEYVSCLNANTNYCFIKFQMINLTNKLNVNKRNAQMAGRDSTRLFIYLFCKQNGEQITEGILIQIRDDSVIVFIPKFGFEGLAPIDKNKYSFKAEIPSLQDKENEVNTLKLFDKIKVSVFASDEYFQNKVIINVLL